MRRGSLQSAFELLDRQRKMQRLYTVREELPREGDFGNRERGARHRSPKMREMRIVHDELPLRRNHQKVRNQLWQKTLR